MLEYRADAFENPVLQQHYRNLEALALDMMAPESIEDLISETQTPSVELDDCPSLCPAVSLSVSLSLSLSVFLSLSAEGGADGPPSGPSGAGV